MRDYWLTQYLLQVVGWGYAVAVLLALLIAAWAPRRNPHKVLWMLIVLGAASILPIKGYRQYEEQKQLSEERKQKYAKAKALFDERCKKSGVFIHRTVENVEGVFLMKLRPDTLNFENQYALDDPYGSDVGGKGYIELFLRDYYEAWPKISPSKENPPTDRFGYQYVEAIDPTDGIRYHYTGSVKAVKKMKIDAPNVQLELKRNPNFDLNIYAYVLDRTPATGPAPRYGVTYDDISTRQERDYWIAGSSLKVIDLQTNEVIAERIGYMVDWAQGIRLGGRSPWLLAANNACPEFAPRHGSVSQLSQTIRFVNKSLKPKELK